MASARSRRSGVPGRSLRSLLALDRLEIGPPKLTRRSVTATYVAVRGSRSERIEHGFSYEEPVFDPRSPESRNLASLLCAQVALNYGLFSREIVFRGAFDEADRRFLAAMAENTAREIFVKKILQPNEFLRDAARGLRPERRERYVQAELRFEGGEELPPQREPVPVQDPPPSRASYAVLSSGGKDSLLSFGLLREMGHDVHPIYANESGRHWYTALNAYRSQKRDWPQTARVWTDSDRVFSWMLRQLPFVRKDFSRIRSDEYPIRLWTAAVFLMGAMPIIRKRGIGRIVIGDEYDTTRRLHHAGIPHHDGLFDQSRWFDNTMTRYYARKGWGISQFSMLRPLSELLIQQILASRYPDLQKDQISCHAAHLDGKRVRPCGACEKCRRIVGMLVAGGADPSRCGYTDDQIDACLRELAAKGVHQEAEGAQQMMWQLASAGRLPRKGVRRRIRERPEVVKLRFDRERSPVDGIPADLRRPLFGILMQHAQGAVRRVGRLWVPFDAKNDPALSNPYPFEAARKTAGPDTRHTAMAERKDHILGELTWQEARTRFKETDLALLPVGAIEQHGPHLPLDVDAWDAEHTAKEVAAACSAPRPLVLPLIPYGVSYHHDDFSGTLSVSPETLAKLVYEIGMSAVRNGITKLVIINGHGGNVPTLQFAAQNINRDARIFTCVETGETSDSDVAGLTETPNDVHAGETETSTSLATRPDLVKMDKAKRFVPRFSSQYLNFTTQRSVEWYARTSKISPTGVLGDPTKATREKGEQIWKIMIEHLVEFVEFLKAMSLDEIYERRY